MLFYYEQPSVCYTSATLVPPSCDSPSGAWQAVRAVFQTVHVSGVDAGFMASQAEQRRAAELARNRAQASTANLGEEEEEDDDDDDDEPAHTGAEPYVRTAKRSRAIADRYRWCEVAGVRAVH